ncbi:putative monovalent cation/H+ antiporter subunit A [candidate division KSB1 bacterium]|nr:putative monovalent cation/H+ antiporter subunit A [candidate division KSB1 bacterium]
MIIVILSSFVIAFISPLIYRIFKHLTGWVLSLVPLALFIYFATYLPQICAEECRTFAFVYHWVPSFGIDLSFYLDGIALIFSLIITLIGAFVVLYGGEYLRNHQHINRFFMYIFLFMGSMIGVVLSSNLITIFIFWELTSFSSYLLIGFNNERAESRYAALQALLITGIGGLALLAGFILLGQMGGSYEITELLTRGHLIRAHSFYLPALILILIGAFTKSAQVPFHFWLPSAMEAPTPVSTYLHSATMVKAGVYLLARLNPMLGDTQAWHDIITIAGTLTMLVGALIAVSQTDLKKILAYTTISALGMLMLLVGVGTVLAIKAAMVFLLVHSLYKGGLFMVAGAIDHSAGTRDITRLSGLWRMMPLVTIAAALAAFSMSGFPPLLGFVGKELIYSAKLQAPNASVILLISGIIANAVNVAAAMMTGIRPFWGKTHHAKCKHIHKVHTALWLGPMLMALLGLIFGLIPNLISMPLISPAVSSITGSQVVFNLQTWHGINLVFLFSIITFILGLMFFFSRNRWRKISTYLMFLKPLYPSQIYEKGLHGLLSLAKWQTKVLQNGYQRFYLITIVCFIVLMGGIQLVRLGGLPDSISFAGVKSFEIGLVLLMALAALAAILSKKRIAAVVSLGVLGYGVALIFVLFGAPDLAMTQILIETLTVIIFVLVIYHLPSFKNFSHRGVRIRDAIISVLAGIMMTFFVLLSINLQLAPTISAYYDENSVILAHGRNIVNVILVDFRGLDTMGEITVLAVAAIGVFALLKLKSKDH